MKTKLYACRNCQKITSTTNEEYYITKYCKACKLRVLIGELPPVIVSDQEPNEVIKGEGEYDA